MHSSTAILLEDSIQLAWEYLEKTGQLGEPSSTSRMLHDKIEEMIGEGETIRLVLSNKAIASILGQEACLT